jgi:hypothetical protein
MDVIVLQVADELHTAYHIGYKYYIFTYISIS